MTERTGSICCAVIFVLCAGSASAQEKTNPSALERAEAAAFPRNERPAPPAPANPKEAAQIDLTGYWVSVVSEDWMYRMLVAPKGDIGSVPVSAEGRKAAESWDPAKDAAAGEQCKSYGAPGLTRMPGRLHITWADDKTLRIDFDAGTQTRLLHFADNLPALGYSTPEPPLAFGASPAATGEPSWIGYSVASWHKQGQSRGLGFGGPPTLPKQNGSLAVITTHLKPGYVQSNGVPYGAQAVLKEYFDVVSSPGEDAWLIVTSVLEDSQYLSQPFVTSTHFKREADGKKWHPRPCGAQ
jgi:hypothetical protein